MDPIGEVKHLLQQYRDEANSPEANSFVTRLESLVEQIQADIAQLQEQDGANQQLIVQLERRVAVLDDQLADLSMEISAFPKAVADWANRLLGTTGSEQPAGFDGPQLQEIEHRVLANAAQGFDPAALEEELELTEVGILASLQVLNEFGYVEQDDEGAWYSTSRGEKYLEMFSDTEE